ncbi:hypothetical protein [Amycolatopsis sp. cmx-4-68]|uniref:hypothetical protein n=1 Tax=Amycolatopsis sp. cmx-4-68 TaxID=2790938 RepID=UPI003979FE66
MSKENAATSEAKEDKPGLRIAQVLAAALAAVTAALLGSTLGVAGTVAGAGVASVVSTVGSELYLRSLQRTREAALKARQLATSGIRRRGPADLASAEVTSVDLAEQPTVQLPRPETPPADGTRGLLRKLRWPLIIATSVAAFAVAILSIVGVEAATGGKVAGGTSSGIGKIFTGGSGHEDRTPVTTPAPGTEDTQVSPTETGTTPTSPTPTTTTTESPTTTPSTTTQQPSTSAPATTATPPTSKAAPTTSAP